VKMDRETLVRLQVKLAKERGRILADPGPLTASERIPQQMIRELADIDFAARAVAAELARHRPRLGYGSET
jgi:hypothetical protein